MNAPAHTAAHNLLFLLLLETFFSANSFSFDGYGLGSHCQTRLHSSISLDEMGLQSGGFGITTTHPQATVRADAAPAAAAAEFSLQDEPSTLIPTSSKPLAETFSYDEDLDLPYLSLHDTDPAYETLAAVELSVSRMAMIAALGLFSVEFTTGTSVLDQVLRMIG